MFIYATNDELWAIGRNGMMKQIGLEAIVLSGVLHLSPINTRCVGNCIIQMDKQLARQLIPILKKFSGVCDE